MAISHPIPNFPFTFYMVGPTGQPRKAAAVRFATFNKSCVLDEKGNWFVLRDIFRFESDAWEAGAQRLADRQAKIAKQQQNLDKHMAAFAKARPK